MRGNPVRKTILYGAAGALLAAIGCLVLAFAAMQERAEWPADGGTVLWAVEGAPGDALGAGVIGVLRLDPAGGAALFVPGDLSVKGRDGRLMELGDLGASEGWDACADVVEGLLGVSVTGYIALTSRDAVAFLDGMGPVRMTVPAAVTYRASPAAGTAIDIERGERALSGAEIFAYVAGTSQDSAAERRERALRAILEAAGAADDDSAASARRILSRARSNLDMGGVWAALQRYEHSGVSFEVAEVPTTVIVRDGVGRRVAQVVETEKLVASSLQARSLLTPDDISVTIFNGSGARLAATRAALYLQARGFRVSRIGNADDFGYTTTTVVRLTEEPKAWILRDALPGAARVVTPGEFAPHYDALRPDVPPGVDLVLVVGAGMEFGP